MVQNTGMSGKEKSEDQIQYREVLRNIGERILEETRAELYVSMRFLGPALGSLQPVMDLSTFSVGTDAAFVRYNPKFLMRQYIEHPFWLKRVWVHMLLHCLFRHMFAMKAHKDHELWNLCCDIAVESVVDSMDYPAISRPLPEKRIAFYDELTRGAGILSAQRLYRYFESGERDYRKEAAMEQEFGMDDHAFWEQIDQPDSGENPPADNLQQASLPLVPVKRLTEDEWKRLADKVRVELSFGKEAGTKTGSLERFLAAEKETGADWHRFLQKFMVLREEAGVDMDSFDYGFYNYGIQLYGNMPLIEENEFREIRRVEDLIIVLDTSASCEEVLVQQFLNETAAMLLSGDNFFRKVRIHILECDDRVQNDLVVTDPSQMKEYARHFSLKGGFGTDFRPAFSYVEMLRSRKKIGTPKGLLYFTDGKGIYPSRPADYDVAFVFEKDEEPDTSGVPDWAMKLFI